MKKILIGVIISVGFLNVILHFVSRPRISDELRNVLENIDTVSITENYDRYECNAINDDSVGVVFSKNMNTGFIQTNDISVVLCIYHENICSSKADVYVYRIDEKSMVYNVRKNNVLLMLHVEEESEIDIADTVERILKSFE